VEKGYLSGEQNVTPIDESKKPKIEELKTLLPEAKKN
jgi:hypothetical protein